MEVGGGSNHSPVSFTHSFKHRLITLISVADLAMISASLLGVECAKLYMTVFCIDCIHSGYMYRGEEVVGIICRLHVYRYT